VYLLIISSDAGHLPGKEGYYRRCLRPLAATYLTFSPNGQDLLVNLGGEQVYLFSELSLSQPVLAQYKNLATISSLFDDDKFEKMAADELPSDANNMKLEANKLYEKKKFNQAIAVYNSALEMKLHPTLLANRAAALLKRNW
jgi:WD and tetratricopeptide repeat-containing protein 1